MNQTLEQYLQIYCNYQQDNWSEQFAYNNTPSATTGITPFFSNKGYHPNLTVHPECDLASTCTHEFVTNLTNSTMSSISTSAKPNIDTKPWPIPYELWP